jgi:hypothetical protein
VTALVDGTMPGPGFGFGGPGRGHR